MGILLLPKFPPDILGIHPFVIAHHAKLSADASRSDLHRLLGCVPETVPIRGVLFFFIQRQKHVNICIDKLREYYPSEVAIIGGFVDKIRFHDRRGRAKGSSSNTCGLVLTGDPARLRIQQVVLGNDVCTREAIRDKLKQLQTIDDDRCVSFAFQISCVARGASFYNDEPDVECSEFRRLFPRTPLIGIFGNGELGYDYPSSDRSPKESELFLGYSTVFSLVSISM